LRIFIGIRFVAEIPQSDDNATILWLQKWSQGIHDWGFIWQRHNGHPMVLYYLANLGQYLLNGYWDGRLDFLVYAFIHTAYAAIVIMTFWNVLTPRDRGWLLTLIFVLFAVPFAGYRIAWGLLWPDTAMMVFSLSALYLAAYRGQSWSAVIFISILAALASVNTAAGLPGWLHGCRADAVPRGLGATTHQSGRGRLNYLPRDLSRPVFDSARQ
jgi:signal transduction histidine kinase